MRDAHASGTCSPRLARLRIDFRDLESSEAPEVGGKWSSGATCAFHSAVEQHGANLVPVKRLLR